MSTLITGSAGVLVGLGLLVEVAELGVPVRVLLALDGLGVALQAEPLAPAAGHRRCPRRPGAPGGSAPPPALRVDLRRPPQRRHRITPLIRLHQRQQRRAQPRIQIGGPLAARRPAGGPGPAAPRPDSSSPTPRDTVASRTPAARATSRIPPCPSARASAPISSRRCRSSRCGKITPNFAASTCPRSSISRPYHTSMPIPGSYGLFLCKPLAYFDHVTVPVVMGLAARSSGAARRHQQRLPRASRRVGQALVGPGRLVRPPLIRRTGCRHGTSRTGRGSDRRLGARCLTCLPGGPHDLASAILRVDHYNCLGGQSLGRFSSPRDEVAPNGIYRVGTGCSRKRTPEKVNAPAGVTRRIPGGICRTSTGRSPVFLAIEPGRASRRTARRRTRRRSP